MNCFCLQRGEVHLFSYLWRTVIRYCVTHTGMQSQMSSLICLLPETNERVCHYVAPVRYYLLVTASYPPSLLTQNSSTYSEQ